MVSPEKGREEEDEVQAGQEREPYTRRPPDGNRAGHTAPTNKLSVGNCLLSSTLRDYPPFDNPTANHTSRTRSFHYARTAPVQQLRPILS